MVEPSFWPLKNLSKTLNWGCLQKLDLQILKTDQVTAILSLKKKFKNFLKMNKYFIKFPHLIRPELKNLCIDLSKPISGIPANIVG